MFQRVCTWNRGQVEDSITHFNRAIDFDPGKADAYAARGSAYFRLGKHDNASSDYKKAIELDPEMGKTQDAQKIECRRIAFLGTKFKEKICLLCF